MIPRHRLLKARKGLLYFALLTAVIAFLVAIYRGGMHLTELRAEDMQFRDLPGALFLSLMRMTVSYLASLVFSFGLGLMAARTRLGERIIIPLLDILQSVPVVGFFPAAIAFFIGITNGHRLGVELAATFLIFTSQAWNIAFAVYEAVKSIPDDQFDVVRSFGIRGAARFWKLYAPSCVPRIVYNSILSWSNGWFFLVACEIIAIGQMKFFLPGIGSFLALAAEQNQIDLIFSGLFCLTLLILTLDFFIWRPVSAWSERFKEHSNTIEDEEEAMIETLPKNFINRITPLLPAFKKVTRALFFPFLWIIREILLPIFWDLPIAIVSAIGHLLRTEIFEPPVKELPFGLYLLRRSIQFIGIATAISIAGYSIWTLTHLLAPPWPPIAKKIPTALLASTGRLLIALFISMAWTIPLVLFVWNRPKLKKWVTTLAQVGASLPAIALFPLIILVLVKKLGGGMEISSILLLLTGMQWYLLFNGLGGLTNISESLSEVTASFGIRGWKAWPHLVIPAIRPALVTGAITAWGAGWNALVVAEYLNFQGKTLQVHGIGALLNYSVYELGDTQSMSLCIGAMIAWILLINVIFWRPIYQISIERYKI